MQQANELILRYLNHLARTQAYDSATLDAAVTCLNQAFGTQISDSSPLLLELLGGERSNSKSAEELKL